MQDIRNVTKFKFLRVIEQRSDSTPERTDGMFPCCAVHRPQKLIEFVVC